MPSDKNGIAEYRTAVRAGKHADQLRQQFPQAKVLVVPHPYTFGYAVSVTVRGRTAYALKQTRKR